MITAATLLCPACRLHQTECNIITPPTTGTVLTMAVLMSDGALQVLKCRDHKTGELVALKVIRNQKRFHKQAQVEVKILEHLRAQVTIFTKSHTPLNSYSRNCCLWHNPFSCCWKSMTSCAVTAWSTAEPWYCISPALLQPCTASALHCISPALLQLRPALWYISTCTGSPTAAHSLRAHLQTSYQQRPAIQRLFR